ncbi:MAG: DNA primase [Balneolaceae bacterium]
MISDDKKEEIRETADIVEVVGDYVKLKKSGSGFMGLCPFHNEKTPSFHVTPAMGIYKCFGCGAAGDVFNFVMEMEGVSFPESLRSLAERYGIDIPDEHVEGEDDQTRAREGIYHSLKFAGLFFNRQLMESDEAAAARAYLEKRGYNKSVMRSFGLGYAPTGSQLLKAAQKEGIDEEYLAGADLVKPDNRNNGFYDTFRDRLMFPIFNPSGKVIAFAGRILTEAKKTAKYINSAQTPVYNKSEVVYGINFAKNEIRRHEEVILVEGYTDVITMHQHGLKNVVASSGTSLTSKQINILQRYGNRIVMIYDADSAGQKAMDRGMNIALEQGMEVFLMELPDGDDPDSFVKQFGKESFLDYKKKHAEDFVTFTIQKAEKAGKMERPGDRSSTIHQVLESISLIPEELDRQLYVQHLHQKTQKYRKGSDRELFLQLEKIVGDQKRKQKFRPSARAVTPPHEREEENRTELSSSKPVSRKKPHYEMEIIRLLLQFGEKMRQFIGHNVGDDHFEDMDLRKFYQDIMQRHVKKEELSAEHYTHREQPYPSLLGDIMLERYSVSENHARKTGNEFKRDRNPIKTAKSAMKSLRLHFLERKRREISEEIKTSAEEQKSKWMTMLTRLQKEISRIQKISADELFDDPVFLEDDENMPAKKFEYKMKGEE